MTEHWIDGRRVTVTPGETILTAARGLGIPIPTLCHGQGLPHHTSCMVCLVEIEPSGRLVPACSTPSSAHTRIRTDTDRVRAARKTAVELLLAEHDGDCRAPCELSCPARAPIPAVARRLRVGDTTGARELLTRRLAFPGILARVCPAPCARSCRRREVDREVDIRALALGAVGGCAAGAGPWTPTPARRSGRSIAIVGAGPAGCSVAYFLALAGHQCVLFESGAVPGGGLRSAVGSDRLPAAVLDAELGVLERLGVELHLGVGVGGSPGAPALEQLARSHHAVVLATGSRASAAALAPGAADPETGATTTPGVFAVGNALRESPTRLAARSVADGRRVARSVGLYLAGSPVTAPRKAFHARRRPRRASDLEAMVLRARRPTPPVAGPEAAEAARCLECDCAAAGSCVLRRLAAELDADPHRFERPAPAPVTRVVGRGGLSLESSKCIRCGLCVRIAERAGVRPGLAFSGRGALTRVRVPFGGDPDEALGVAADACVRACPTGALAWDTRMRRDPCGGP